MSEIRDIKIAPEGHKKISWVEGYMPILNSIEREFNREKPFRNMKIAVSVHLEAKTAYLSKVLKSGGADVTVTGSNPLSTQDDVAAALVEDGLNVFSIHGATNEEYNRSLNKVLDTHPDIIIDDGGDLVQLLHSTRQDLAKDIMGGCEETTTGILRLRARERENKLLFPMIDVNDAYCKHLFDNRYGTGQSVWDGIMRTTNLIVAGKNVVIAGYGWCGKGAAMRAKGLGARVIITEIDPIKAIEAVMDGFKVMTMEQAAEVGDIFVTVTGCNNVIRKEHFEKMKNGVLLANAGHFDVEISKPDLLSLSKEVREMKKNIEGYVMKDGRILNLLADGRLVNLAAGDGHPAEIMDMSFGIQALSVKYIAQNHGELIPKVYQVPSEIDKRVALTKLKSMEISIDSLTEDQRKYLNGWGE